MLKYIITWDIRKQYVYIQTGQKAGLLKLVKSPIGAKKTFQIYEDAQKLGKSDRKDNKWWKDIRNTIFLDKKK